MKKWKLMLTVLATGLFFVTGITSYANGEMTEKGLNHAKNAENKKALYWHNIDSNWYYFGKDGKRAILWNKLEPKVNVGKFEGDEIHPSEDALQWYYFTDMGAQVENGWQYLPVRKENINVNLNEEDKIKEIGLPNCWYYLGKDGYVISGWLKDNGSWYYLDKKESNYGAMKTGWIYDNGTWYYLSGSGAMETGWIYDNGTWYYLSSSGAMETGWIYDDGTWYYLNNSGAMRTY